MLKRGALAAGMPAGDRAAAGLLLLSSSFGLVSVRFQLRSEARLQSRSRNAGYGSSSPLTRLY